MPPFAESRNFRGWWVSKTPLEQKLIILSSVLFVLSFCLTISVIVLDNRKPPACWTTTVAPDSNSTTTPADTEPPATTPTKPEPPATTPTKPEPPATTPTNPEPPQTETPKAFAPENNETPEGTENNDAPTEPEGDFPEIEYTVRDI